jgi:hypothetical protein
MTQPSKVETVTKAEKWKEISKKSCAVQNIGRCEVELILAHPTVELLDETIGLSYSVKEKEQFDLSGGRYLYARLRDPVFESASLLVMNDE